jgi:hypothetical protein
MLGRMVLGELVHHLVALRSELAIVNFLNDELSEMLKQSCRKLRVVR